MTLILTVDEGEPYFLGDLTWDGVSVLDQADVDEAVTMKKGDRFSELRVGEMMAAVQSLYFDKGYVYAFIDPVPAYGPEDQEGKRVVDVVMRVIENEPARVAHINVLGNTKTKDHVIRREILLKPGDTFSRVLFERSIREVMSLNYFANVELDPPPTPTANGDLDVSIKVTEKPTGQATMGAGWSERDGLIGNLGVQLPNLFGNGQQFSFTWDFGRIRRTISFGFTEPWFLNTPTLVGFNVYDSELFWTTFYKQKRRGFSFQVGRRLRWPDDYFRTSVGYRLEDVIFSDFSANYNPSPDFDLRQFDWPIRGSAVSWTIYRDSRDRPEFPTQGSINSLRVEVAGGPFGGDQQFVKWDMSQSFYFQSFASFVLNMRVKAGLVEGFSGWGREAFVPFNEKYLAGGTSFDGQIRGYENRRVGPQDQDGLEVGGQSLLIFTLEYTFPIAPQQSLFGLVFADAGNSWIDLGDTDPFDLRRSVGFGVRMFTPLVGLIGFDFAYGFDHFENGRRVGRWVPHFQFGQQFF
jgi:outer membrane protein insertion porin family